MSKPTREEIKNIKETYSHQPELRDAVDFGIHWALNFVDQKEYSHEEIVRIAMKKFVPIYTKDLKDLRESERNIYIQGLEDAFKLKSQQKKI